MPSLAAYALRRALTVLVVAFLAPPIVFFVLSLVAGGQDLGGLLTSTREYTWRTYVHFDLGTTGSPVQPEQISHVLLTGLPIDVGLVAGGLVLGVLIGGATGLRSSAKPRGLEDYGFGLGWSAALSVPVYWLAYLSIFLFAPGTGEIVQIPFLSPAGGYEKPLHDPIGYLHAMWVPALSIALPLAATVHRMTRSAMVEVIDSDPVRTARAKGLREGRILLRHVTPAGAPPVLVLTAASLALLVTNAVLIETPYSLPGLFKTITIASQLGEQQHTPPQNLVQAVVLEAAFVIALGTLACDVLIAWLDPRVRARG